MGAKEQAEAAKQSVEEDKDVQKTHRQFKAENLKASTYKPHFLTTIIMNNPLYK